MYHIIVNPKSRSGQGQAIWMWVRKRLLEEACEYRVYLTRYYGHAGKIAGKLTGVSWNPKDVLVIIGGDGTVNEVVNGIVRLSEVTVGYIPTGSGNDFARGLGIPSDSAAALERILNPKKVCEIDIGMNRMNGRSRRFTISTGIGFDAGICHKALASRMKNTLNKLKLGKLTYVCIALKELAVSASHTITVTQKEGETRVFEHAFFAVAMNLPYEGGGCKFAPDADPGDRLLDVMIVSQIPKWKVLLLLPLAIKGRHTGFKEIHMIRCRSISIGSEKRLPVHLDGESGGYQKEMEISLESERLKIILA
jgi:YegS/Rv2252/BmrU family lipid kinase